SWSVRKKMRGRQDGWFVRPTVPLWEQARPGRRADQTRPFDREQGGQIENSGRGPVEFWGRRMIEYGVLCMYLVHYTRPQMSHCPLPLFSRRFRDCLTVCVQGG